MWDTYLFKILEYLNINVKLSFLISAIVAFIITICISVTSLHVIFLAVIGLMLWLILFIIIKFAIDKIYEYICSYEVDATVDHIFVDEIEIYGMNAYCINLCVDYEYNSKKYRGTLKFHHSVNLRSGSKIKLKICKFCPKIIYIEKEY